MCRTDVSPREHQVFHIFGIQAAVRDTVWRGRGMPDGGRLRRQKARGMVVIHRPAAIRNQIVKFSFSAHIILIQKIVAHIPAAFALARQETDPFNFPVCRVTDAPVLDEIPDAVNGTDQLVAHGFCVRDRVNQTAQLHPPEIAVVPFLGRGEIDLVLKVFLFKVVRPGRRNVCGRPGGLAHLEQARHAHGAGVALLRGDIFPEFLA